MNTVRPGPLRVALADDHAVVRAGYRRLLELETDIAVVTEFDNAESTYSALTCAEALTIDLLILDLSMPGRSGLELLRRLSRRRPELRVLIFTMHDSPAMVDQCLRAGAIGFVTKTSQPQVLVDAVKLAARGKLAMSPDVQTLAASAAGVGAPHTRLSHREFDILRQLLADRSAEEIARTLSLSVKTVANYQTHIRQVLGVASAVGLVNYAREHGLLDPMSLNVCFTPRTRIQ